MKKLCLGAFVVLAFATTSFALPAMPPQPESDDLTLYNACTNEWIATGLPHRDEPTFEEDLFLRPARFIDRTFQIDNEDYRLYNVDLFHIEKHMKAGGGNIPNGLRGIWWMDGNPVPEVVLSFGDATYNPETRTIENTFNGPNSYLVTPSILGRLYWEIVDILKGQVKVNIPQDIDMDNLKFGDKIFVSFTTTIFNADPSTMPTYYINENHWRRDTNDHCYNLRQIVDEEGRKLPTYDYFVQQVRIQTKKYLGHNPDVLMQARPVQN